MTLQHKIPLSLRADRYFSAGSLAADFIKKHPTLRWKEGRLGRRPANLRWLLTSLAAATATLPLLLAGSAIVWSFATGFSWLTAGVFGLVGASLLYLMLAGLTNSLERNLYPDFSRYPVYFLQWQISQLLTVPIREVNMRLVAKLAQYHAHTSCLRNPHVIAIDREIQEELALIRTRKAEEESRKKKEAQERAERRQKYRYDDDDETDPGRNTASYSSSNSDYDDSFDFHQDDHCVNPASGLPMFGGIGGFDAAGNVYGHNDWD